MTPSAPECATAGLALEMVDVSVPTLHDPSVVVLEDVHWNVMSGDYWAIGGLQRSGKSDLVALAAGLTQPAQGTLRVFGQDSATDFAHDNQNGSRPVGLVFDGGRLLQHLTIAENIALPLLYHLSSGEPVPGERIRALLDLTGLAPWGDRRPAEVSRNWQQRIGLARALACPPQILLLDSPLSGLDPREASWWLDLLDQLSAGHPILDSRPLTLVVTADDLRPWIDRARQFAVIRGQDRRFLALGSRAAALEHAEPLLHDLLRRPPPRGPAP